MVNVILDAKNQSFKLCAVDGIDLVRSGPKALSHYFLSLELVKNPQLFLTLSKRK